MKKFINYGVSALLALSMFATLSPVGLAADKPAPTKVQKTTVKKPAAKKTVVTKKVAPKAAVKGKPTGKAAPLTKKHRMHKMQHKKGVSTGKACPITQEHQGCPCQSCK